MTKDEAFRLVAEHMHGWMAASTFAEVTGLTEDQIDALSARDIQRIEDAAEDIQSRMSKLADRGRPRD